MHISWNDDFSVQGPILPEENTEDFVHRKEKSTVGQGEFYALVPVLLQSNSSIWRQAESTSTHCKFPPCSISDL